MKRIGKYEVRGLLGRGGMGAVYKVRVPGLDRILALKLLSPRPALTALLGREEIRTRFLAEARTLGRLRHRNIISVYDFDDHPEQTFFVMEYYCHNLGSMIGETYNLEAKSRLLDPVQAAGFARQALEGLNRLHRAGIVHRDIKPYNLLLADDLTVKIADFGLSMLRGETFGSSRLHVGSPFYAAPEQEKNPSTVNHTADLYSIGVMLYRFLTGRLIVKPESGDIVRSGLKPAAEWISFFQKALAENPEDRFASALEMALYLDELLKLSETAQATCNPEKAAISGETETSRHHENRPEKKPAFVRPKEARRIFGINELMQPLETADRDLKLVSEELVLDRHTGLCWQRKESDFPMTWEESRDYVAAMNKSGFCEKNDWRLPTVREIISLLNIPPKPGAYCLDMIFRGEQGIFWSSDRRSAIASWYVSMDQGFVGWNDNTCYHYVRAVSNA